MIHLQNQEAYKKSVYKMKYLYNRFKNKMILAFILKKSLKKKIL